MFLRGYMEDFLTSGHFPESKREVLRTVGIAPLDTLISNRRQGTPVGGKGEIGKPMVRVFQRCQFPAASHIAQREAFNLRPGQDPGVRGQGEGYRFIERFRSVELGGWLPRG